MTRDDLFNINASIVRDLAEAVAKHAPQVNIPFSPEQGVGH